MDITLPYECRISEINYGVSAELYIDKVMRKYLSCGEYRHWKLNRKRESCIGKCSICGNRCEKCILFYVGLPWLMDE